MAGKTQNYELRKMEITNEGDIVAGDKICDYHSNTMLAPTMKITAKSGKKYRIRCIDTLKDGTRRAIVE